MGDDQGEKQFLFSEVDTQPMAEPSQDTFGNGFAGWQ